jgi:hypothetical protein
MSLELWERIGREAYGPLYLGFGGWLKARVLADRPERLFFLSRDGHVVERLWRKLVRDGEGPPASYLYGSRRAFKVPALTRLDEPALAFLCGGTSRLTVAQYLARAGLDPRLLAPAITSAGLELDTVVGERERPRLRALFLAAERELLEVAARERSLLSRYLAHVGLDGPARVAVVDLGWHGTLQRALGDVLAASGSRTVVDGYYLATFAEARAHASMQRMAGFVCEFGEPERNLQTLRACVELFELGFVAPHGGVDGYRDHDGAVEPILAPHDLLDQDRDRALALQAGALAFVDHELARGVKALAPEQALAPMARLLGHPTVEEARALGDLCHAEGFGPAVERRPIARPPTLRELLRRPRALGESLQRAFWQEGWKTRVLGTSRPLRSLAHLAWLLARPGARRAAALGAAAVLGVALVAWAMWPGVMSSDAFDQLGQARRDLYSPWHPPIMAALWHYSDRILRGPGGMLLLQAGLLWASLAALTALALRRTRWGWTILLIGLCPPVFVHAGHVWKDTQMAAALTATVALLAIARELERPRLAWLCLPLLFYATGVRHNGVSATLPLTVTCALIALPSRRPRWLVAAGGVALGAVIVVANHWLSSALCRGEHVAPIQTNFVHDLVGLSRATGEKLLPPSFFTTYPSLREEQLRALYTPDTSDPIVFQALVVPTQDRRVVGDIRRAWLAAVEHHPRLWLSLRWEMMARQLAIGKAVWSPYHKDDWQQQDAEREENRALGISWRPSRFHEWLIARLEHGLNNSLFFRGWIYLLVTLAALAWAFRRRRLDLLTMAIAASSLCYLAPLFVVAPGPDFRYVFWPVIASMLIPALTASHSDGRG